MEPVGQNKKRSPWLYVGIGCGALLLLGIGGFIFGVAFLFKKGKQYTEDLSNPIARTEMVKKALGAQTLPEGYHGVMALSVPAIMDMAVLSTRSPDAPAAGQTGDVRSFVYFFIKRSSVTDQEQLKKYLEGQSNDASVLARNNVSLGEGEILGRGAIELEGRRVLYVTQRGELETEHDDREGPGLNSILFIECQGQERMRMGIWMAPDPSPGAPLEQLDLKGTPADPEALRAFMSHLNPCQES
ncbi:hypothetical protein [Hyalangium sp.]|uniref:hypothetical protein n=1 Tax=Hyalangium sp. TaxID=2028555 RepID=UPI002D464116|nr:hypothetical protein [Hyalangium sp.]HYI03003.1 hypothetical protein [Hyalangium sp.]